MSPKFDVLDEDFLVDEAVAVASVHPDAMHFCTVRDRHGHETTAVVQGRCLCFPDDPRSSAGLEHDKPELLDPYELEQALRFALQGHQKPKPHAMLPHSEMSALADSAASAFNAVSPPTLAHSQLEERNQRTGRGPGITMQLLISPEALPDPGIPVALCYEASTSEGATCGPSQRHITRLPPFRLTIHTAAGYPGSQTPALVLEAPWMRPAALMNAARALQGVAAGLGPGAPVLLAWLGWLRGDSTAGLSELAVMHDTGSIAVHMCPQGNLEQVEVEHALPQADVLRLVLRHDAHAREQEFQATAHPCSICLEHRLGSNGIRSPCGHWHCRACMQELAAACMRESNAAGIRCPEPDCRADMPPHVVQELLSSEELARWEELMLQKGLSAMRDVVFCPRCQVAAVESEDWARCSCCGFAFCSLCYDAYHPGVQCSTAEQRIQVLDMRAARCGNNDKVLAEARRLKQQLEDEQYVRGRSKPCPWCGAAIEKSGGCNKVVCAMCKGRMCWKCETAIDGYEHFRDSSCVLLEDPEIRAWEQEWALMVAEHREDARGLLGPQEGGRAREDRAQTGARCPQCRSWCEKVARNNHLKCPWCQGDFCCLCGTVLRGRAAIKNHFGKSKGCLQHS